MAKWTVRIQETTYKLVEVEGPSDLSDKDVVWRAMRGEGKVIDVNGPCLCWTGQLSKEGKY